MKLEKIEQFLFYLFLFSIPISLRHIFGYAEGNFLEWKAISLYGTDILLGILFIFWVLKSELRKITLVKSDWLVLGFLVVVGISIQNALDKGVAVFQFVKLLEGVVLYFYVKNYALKRFDITACFTVLVCGALFQSIIAIPQFMLQHSLGLKYLGESPLNGTLTGVGAFLVDGIKVIRAYGTVPHPNILAAYIFVALGAFYYIGIYTKKRWWWHVFHGAMLWAFFLTFSRTIIALWVLNFIIRTCLIRWYPKFRAEFWDKKDMRIRCLKIFITTIFAGLIFVAVYWPYVINRVTISGNDEAIQLRMLYNQQSLAGDIHWTGIGIGNFIPWLMKQGLSLPADQYQPVHNVYLLIYSEIGLVGLGLFLAFLVSLLIGYYRRMGFKKLYHFSFALIVCSLLVFGLFDHFFWTIQSGRLLFWLALGLLAGAR